MGNRYVGVFTIYDCYDKVKVESLKDIQIEDEHLAHSELDNIDEFICEAIDRYEDVAGYEE